MGTAAETASALQRTAAAETASAQQQRTAETASATATQHTSTPQRPKTSLADATRLAEAGDACAMRDVGCALLRRGAAGDNAAGVALLERCVASTADAAVLSGAYYGLAYAYDHARLDGVARDAARASACLAESAACGNAQALDLVATRRRLRRRARCIDGLLAACFVVMFFAAWTLRDLLDVVQFKSLYEAEVPGSDARTVETFRWRRGVFDGARRGRLLERGQWLLDATAARDLDANASNPLSDGFSGTRGVVVHFTRDALGDGAAFGHAAYAWLRDGFLDELLDDRCNAFVFNILVIPPGRAAAADGAGGVGSHVDQTLIQSTTIREQTAFHVSVGYMRVPDGLAGGELVLDGRAHHPAEGDVLTFRGDLAHKVRPFCGGGAASCDRDADPAKARVSFVLEQYRLPPEKLARSPSFVVAPSKREQSAIPVVASLRPFGPALVELYLALRRRWLSPRHAPPR